MSEVPDWRHRGGHIARRSARKGRDSETDILTSWANEAFADPMAWDVDPDPASRSGLSARTIGWSDSAGFLITVITVRDSDGRLHGATAFRSSSKDQRRYEGEEHD